MENLDSHASYVNYRIQPDKQAGKSVLAIYQEAFDSVAKSLAKKGWKITRPGIDNPFRNEIDFSASKDNSYLELERPLTSSDDFRLHGGIRDDLQKEVQDSLKQIDHIHAHQTDTYYAPSIKILSDQERIDYYSQNDIRDSIHETINNIVKNHPSTRQSDVELEVCRRIKNGNMRGSFYCPDQFWNTTQENQPLLGIMHQEVEGMKRSGILKANEQTGELAIGNARKQETSR